VGFEMENEELKGGNVSFSTDRNLPPVVFCGIFLLLDKDKEDFDLL